MKKFILCGFVFLFSIMNYGQNALPIIDMHLHALPVDFQGPPPVGICTPIDPLPVWDQLKPYGATMMNMMKKPPCTDPVWSPVKDEELMNQTIEVMERRNIYGVLSGTPERVSTWMKAAPGRFYPGLGFRITDDMPSTADLRKLHTEGRLAVLAEITNQYEGIAPEDPRMEPYWTLAEELDMPVGIHIGPGPPGVAYLGSMNYRAHLSSALTLENVLVKHPRLRVYIMHAGYPLRDDLLAVLYAYPQVYVGIGIIVSTVSRPAFYSYLRAIIDGGFENRIMFGSDQMVWPGLIERSITVIEEAPFLSQKQKRDIFYDNAARFLRLDEKEKARHRKL